MKVVSRHLNWSVAWVLAIVLALQPGLVYGADPSVELVKDVYSGEATDEISYGYLIPLGSELLFMADTPTTGEELWKTDGTESGTVLVKDINPGSADACGPHAYAVFGDTLIFEANDGIHGGELWKSDGTEGGTVLLKDINPGASSSHPYGYKVLGSDMYFRAESATTGSELWKTDGTTDGTVLVKDINPGTGSSRAFPGVVMGGELYFYANDGTGGHQLWKTDGTANGTVLVKDIDPGNTSVFIQDFAVIGSLVLFGCKDGTSGYELWKSDGTAGGTELVKDINPGSQPGIPSLSTWTVVGSTLYFMGDDGTTGQELWKSDGTAGGTELVKDINPGSADANPWSGVEMGGAFYFGATGTEGESLWKTDGTEAGTVLVKDTSAGIAPVMAVGSTLFCGADDGTYGAELWKSDGTEAGTVFVKDINEGQADSELQYAAVLGSTLYFRADDGTHGLELWKSDGTEAGTVLVRDINTDELITPISELTAAGSTLFCLGNDVTAGHELWKSDGTEAGTVLVKDINPGVFGSGLQYLTALGSTVFFCGDDFASGTEGLWKSDGTEAGTVLVKNFNPGASGSGLSQMTALGSTVFFWGDDGTSGYGMWKSDGTEAGTEFVKDIDCDEYFGDTAVVGSTLYFMGDDGTSGDELWKSDGTEAGTVRVKDIRSGVDSSSPNDLTAVGSVLYFRANDGIYGDELWKSDGTEAGTVLVKDINPGSESGTGYLDTLGVVGSTLYFMGDDGTSGTELWKSDGTEAGTVLVKDIQSGSDSGLWGYLVRVGSGLFFVANDGTSGWELWRSDGTEAGTVRVKDIWSGVGSSSPSDLTAVGSVLYFQANDGIYGEELWKSDGTEAGTVRVGNIASGSGGCRLWEPVLVDERLFFRATSDSYGEALWAYDTGLPAAASDLSVTAQSAISVKLDWTDNASNEGGFRIERRASQPTAVAEVLNGRDASLQPAATTGPTWVSDGTEGLWRFDGVDDYAKGRDWSGVEGKDAITVSAWINPDAVDEDAVIVSKGNVSLDTVWVLWQDATASASGRSRTISFGVSSGASRKFTRVEGSTDAAEAGEWTHVAAVWQRSPETVKLYINGVLDQENTDLKGVTMGSNADPVLLGAGANLGTLYDGDLKGVRVYSRALVPADVAALHTAGRDASAGVVGLWDFELFYPGGKPWQTIGAVSDSIETFTDTPAPSEANMDYRVVAYNVNGEASGSSPDSVETDVAVLPAAPSGLTATATGSTSVRLDWTDNADNETGFAIERAPGSLIPSLSDTAGAGRHGTLKPSAGSGPAWIPGIQQGLYRFDGVDDYADAGDINAVEGLDAISVSAWINPDSIASDAVLLSKGNLSLNSTWVLWQDASASVSGRSRTICFGVSSGTSRRFTRVEGSTEAARAGEWTHVVAVWQRSPETVKLYEPLAKPPATLRLTACVAGRFVS